MLEDTHLWWACNYRILRLNFGVYWGRRVIHRDVDILPFSTQHGNSEIILGETKGKAIHLNLYFNKGEFVVMLRIG